MTIVEKIIYKFNILSDADFKGWMLNSNLIEDERKQIEDAFEQGMLSKVNGLTPKELEMTNKSEMKSRVKEYCKNYKLKFEKYTNDGFIASNLVDVKAGIETDLHTGKIVSVPIRVIAKKRIYWSFLYYLDGDIVENGIV